MDVVSAVRVLTGKECGKARNLSKDDLDTRAGKLVAKSNAEAAAAALAAMP